jgi:uncharacterized protein (DUF488 family)
LFKHGLKRVVRGIKDNFKIALMCAEKEPLECHWTILIAMHLAARGLQIEHIHVDGHLESHDAALSRLARIVNLPDEDMFRSHEELLADAYQRQGERIAYEIAQTSETATSGCAWVRIFTIGFTKKSVGTFFTRLKNVGIKRLIDVRLNNVS